jgi:starvation-inducible DNA-binding protein
VILWADTIEEIWRPQAERVVVVKEIAGLHAVKVERVAAEQDHGGGNMATIERKVSAPPTRNDLPEKVRHSSITLLNARLADAIDLMMQAKHAHWNVRGPHFFSLHELFDKVYEDVAGYVDVIAERAGQLGGAVQGTIRANARQSTPLALGDGSHHVEAVAAALASFGEQARAAIAEADRLGDADTADIFTEVSRGIDKLLWFVESHAERLE